jgi:hypothetical protein
MANDDHSPSPAARTGSRSSLTGLVILRGAQSPIAVRPDVDRAHFFSLRGLGTSRMLYTDRWPQVASRSISRQQPRDGGSGS